MKTRIINVFIPIVALTIFLKSNPVKGSIISDTLPEKVQKTDTVTFQNQTEDFSDLEMELDSLSPKAEGADTTTIRIGKMKISVMEDGKDIAIDKEEWDDEDEDDNSWNWDNDHFDGHKKEHKKNKFDPHWAGFAMGLNNYAAADYNFSLPADYRFMDLNTNVSYQVDLNLVDLGINLINQKVGLVTGVGFRWNNYKFSNVNMQLKKGTDSLEYFYDTTQNYSKSKLTIAHLTIPLMLEVQIPLHSEDLYIAAGVEGTMKLGAHTKTKTESGEKNKNPNDFYINTFAYNLSARVGYGDFGIYATYNMSPLFKKDQGPELYPYCVGVSLNF